MSDSDLLIKGDLIKSRWRIIQKIGGGGFGQIFKAYDKLRRELVAVKVESNCQARQGIRMEVTVLRRIVDRQHVCDLLSTGSSTFYNYMVMTLLGSSLSELRRAFDRQTFSLSTSLRISLQILQAIESIHSVGFLHRDIKPSNFAIGKSNLRQLFIVDFGLARKFTDNNDHLRPARTDVGFRGTVRYASINAHNNLELGRHDDLWSFFYMLVEFLIGSLPWSRVKDKDGVGRLKKTYDYNRFLSYLPDEFDKFLEHISQLCYEDTPNYEYLRGLFIASIERLGFRLEDPYDWENFSELEHKTARNNVKFPQTINQRSKSRMIIESHGDQSGIHYMNPILINEEHMNKPKQQTENTTQHEHRQKTSHAIALGPISQHSQYSPYNDHSHKIDERTTLLSGGGDRISAISSKSFHLVNVRNNSAGQQMRTIEMPFGSYVQQYPINECWPLVTKKRS